MALDLDLARRMRRWGDLAQADVAQQIGVHVETFAAWERGEHAPGVAQVVAWARAIKVRPIDLDPDLEQLARDLLAALPDDGEQSGVAAGEVRAPQGTAGAPSRLDTAATPANHQPAPATDRRSA